MPSKTDTPTTPRGLTVQLSASQAAAVRVAAANPVLGVSQKALLEDAASHLASSWKADEAIKRLRSTDATAYETAMNEIRQLLNPPQAG